ncbi:hypothetical protein K502DRAFT_128842 [Neoconidiobolus thromboides FSU 785]|nr:hypothetical protein K502DRAFT_128842 [Neoconidiobolus thromboides FSU 785]
MDPITEENVCECTDLDYECDFNFQKDKNGRCVLISGKDATKTLCENGISSYNISSGYRKIAMSQCKGGKDLSLPKEVWCPGHGLSVYGFIIRGSNRRGMDWKRIYYVLSPYLCFLPALIVELIYGQGSHGLRQRLFGNRGGYRRGYEYEPVAQYDYDYELDDEFIDGPAEIELNEEEEDDYQDFVGATTDNNINIDNNNLEINFDEDEEDGLL